MPLRSASRARVGQQRHLTGVLDRGGDVALVLGAVPRHPAGADLAAVGDELAQQRRVLVVDVGEFLLAEQANLLLRLAWCRFRHRGAPYSKSPALAGMVGLCLERWVVGEAASAASAAGRPWVVGRCRILAAAPLRAAAEAAALAASAAEAASAALTLDL